MSDSWGVCPGQRAWTLVDIKTKNKYKQHSTHFIYGRLYSIGYVTKDIHIENKDIHWHHFMG